MGSDCSWRSTTRGASARGRVGREPRRSPRGSVLDGELVALSSVDGRAVNYCCFGLKGRQPRWRTFMRRVRCVGGRGCRCAGSVRVPYGGPCVKRAAWIGDMKGGGGGVWLRLAGRSGCPRVSRRWSASYAGAGYPKTLVSSHVRCLFSSAAAGWAVAHGHAADWCARAGDGPGPPRQPQRDVVGLVRASG